MLLLSREGELLLLTLRRDGRDLPATDVDDLVFHLLRHVLEQSGVAGHGLLVLAVGDQIVSEHGSLGRTVLTSLGDLQLSDLARVTRHQHEHTLAAQRGLDGVGVLQLLALSIEHTRERSRRQGAE